MTPAEALAYNTGVLAVLAIADRTARAIATDGARRIPVGFAVAALAELAEAGRAMLIPIDRDGLDGAIAEAGPKRPAGSPHRAEAAA